MTRFTHILVAKASRLLVALAAAGTVAAQAPQPAPGGADKPVEPVAVSEPYTLHDLGLTVHLPEDTIIDTQFIAGGRTKSVLKSPDSEWVIQIFNANSSNTNLTITEVLDNFVSQRRAGLESYQRANPNMFRGADPRLYTDDNQGKSALVVSQRADPPKLEIAGMPAGRFYCETPLINPNLLTGYTVFQRGRGQFVIFQLDCMAELFPRAQRVYETVVASSKFEDAEAENAERATALLAGRSFLQTISNEDLEAVLSDEPRYYRIYRPAPTGLESDATEIGWQRVQMRLGQRGEVDPSRPRDRWTASDRDYGYLVKIDAIMTQGTDKYESQTAYFLDRNRVNESISILNRKFEKGQVTWSGTVTVIRRGPMLTMNRVQTASEGETRDWNLPEEYISRVELELLPLLVAHKTPEGSTAEFDFGFFHFNVAENSVLLRRDKFSNAEMVSGWEYLTEPSPKGPEIPATLNMQGEVIRRFFPDGMLIEEIELERLRELRNDGKIGS